MIEELKAASKQSFVPALFIALVYAGLEDKDQAFTWLDKAYEERFNRLAYLKVDPLPGSLTCFVASASRRKFVLMEMALSNATRL